MFVDDLFVGQYGLVDWVLVYYCVVVVGQVFVYQMGEYVLFVYVVFGCVGGEFV